MGKSVWWVNVLGKLWWEVGIMVSPRIKNPKNRIQNLASLLSRCGGLTHLVGHEGQMSKHRSVQTMVPLGAQRTSVGAPEKSQRSW